MNTEEKFDSDVRWMLEELKSEYLANTYSEYKAEFLISQKSEKNPDERNQRRILKMLSDRKIITISPFYHLNNSSLNRVFEMQGAKPIGYRIQFIQPQFNELYEQVVKQKIPTTVKIEGEKNAGTANREMDAYFITVSNNKVILNNSFILSTPNFDSENANFIEYIIEHQNEKLSRIDVEREMKIKLKKSLKQIVQDLGFKGELKKLFFNISKIAVRFKNYVPQSHLIEIGIDKKKLDKQISKLKKKE